MGAATQGPADAERLRVAHAVCLRPEVMKACFFVWLLYYKAGNLAEAVPDRASGGPMVMLPAACRGPQHRVCGERSRTNVILYTDVRRNRAPMSDLKTHRCYRAHGRGIHASVRRQQSPPAPWPGGSGGGFAPPMRFGYFRAVESDGHARPRCALVTFAQSKVTDHAFWLLWAAGSDRKIFTVCRGK